jgi:serine/threonine protein kinase
VVFTLKELEFATKHFSKEKELGSGAFGTVYKGVLRDGKVVAVKRANTHKAADVEQFVNEVSVLSQVNHRNLVKLLGCCLDLKLPLLVYEYIPNGTLQEHLTLAQHGYSTKLNWHRRFNIAVQTAEALKYLHSEAMPPILHRDVKVCMSPPHSN